MIADIIICIVIGLLILRGLFRGLIRELLFISGLVVGFVVANSFWDVLNPKIKNFFPSEVTSHMASYVILFLASFIGVFLLGLVLRRIFHLTILSWADKLGGAIIGFIKGIIICGAILFLIDTFLGPDTQLVKNSRVTPYVLKTTQKLSILIPNKLRREFKKEKEEIAEFFSEDFWYKLFGLKKGKREL